MLAVPGTSSVLWLVLCTECRFKLGKLCRNTLPCFTPSVVAEALFVAVIIVIIMALGEAFCLAALVVVVVEVPLPYAPAKLCIIVVLFATRLVPLPALLPPPPP